MTTVAAISHPRRVTYHASLACAMRTTNATEGLLTVSTPGMARTAGRRPCHRCWEPRGYDVLRDDRLARVVALGGVVA
jgi:hypothetical protein